MGTGLADGIQQEEVLHHLERNNKRYGFIISIGSKKGTMVLGQFSWGVGLRDKMVLIYCYKTFVRPFLVHTNGFADLL